MTKKTWIIFAVICVAIIGGMIYTSRNNRVNVTDVDGNVYQAASAENGNIGDHTYGNMKSKVILIEYGDYQCPGCASAYSVIKEVTEKYKDKMGFIFRNYPLYSAHPNAFAAAAAAEAAGLQGKYWEMHDKLYSEQNTWKSLTGSARTDYFIQTADQIGISGSELSGQLDNSNIKRKIDFDEALGKKAGVKGTPSFYIDGTNVGDQDVSDGKLIPSDSSSDTPSVWSTADTFEQYIIIPALKKAGIEV